MKKKFCLRTAKNYQTGFSYIEVLIATVLIAITLIPALEAIQGALVGSGIHESLTSHHYLLKDKTEEVLAEPFSALEDAATAAGGNSVATSYSDSSGTPNRRLVFLFGYDADNADADNDPFTGVDDGLIWVRVELESTGQFLETLSSR